MKTFNKEFYSNCLFVALYLKLRYWKKVKIGKVKVKNALFPHYYVRTKKSDIRLHFHHINEYAPEIFYKGIIKVSW